MAGLWNRRRNAPGAGDERTANLHNTTRGSDDALGMKLIDAGLAENVCRQELGRRAYVASPCYALM